MGLLKNSLSGSVMRGSFIIPSISSRCNAFACHEKCIDIIIQIGIVGAKNLIIYCNKKYLHLFEKDQIGADQVVDVAVVDHLRAQGAVHERKGYCRTYKAKKREKEREKDCLVHPPACFSFHISYYQAIADSAWIERSCHGRRGNMPT